MRCWEFEAASEADTERLGVALARCLPPGVVVSLEGTLGAGKTRLVQAVAAACGIARTDVVSPTFVLCHEYHGQRTIYHLDAYRIASESEFAALGVDEYFGGDGISFVEWGDRVLGQLPRDHLVIQIEVLDDTRRRFVCTSRGMAFASFPNTLAAELGAV